MAYQDADGNNDPSNATLLAQSVVTITVADGMTFSNYPVNIDAPGPGDIYVGFADTYNLTSPSPVSYPAPLDTTVSQVRSWVAANSTGNADIVNLSNDDTIGTIDDFGLAGNWVIRASGTTALVGGCPPTRTPTVVSSTATATSTPTPAVTACPIQFNDVPVGSTFYDYIRCLACRGIVGGYPCGGPGEPCPGQYYRPNNNVTRGQVSKIVSELAGFSDAVPSTQQTFQDVPNSGTFWLWIERLSGRGIIGGYPCGGPFEPCVSPGNRPYFRPNNDVTRGQLSKIVSGARVGPKRRPARRSRMRRRAARSTSTSSGWRAAASSTAIPAVARLSRASARPTAPTSARTTRPPVGKWRRSRLPPSSPAAPPRWLHHANKLTT